MCVNYVTNWQGTDFAEIAKHRARRLQAFAGVDHDHAPPGDYKKDICQSVPVSAIDAIPDLNDGRPIRFATVHALCCGKPRWTAHGRLLIWKARCLHSYPNSCASCLTSGKKPSPSLRQLM